LREQQSNELSKMSQSGFCERLTLFGQKFNLDDDLSLFNGISHSDLAWKFLTF
jgi:hypothetical protein